MRLEYWIPNYGECGEDARSISTGNTVTIREAVEYLAEDFHRNGGWNCEWPVIFKVIHALDGTYLGEFEVERIDDPIFHARKVDATP